MNEACKSVQRVIGLDSHPDSFTAAAVRGPTPAAALVEGTFNKVPIGQLSSWARKSTTAQDLIVLEASGNSFQIVRILQAVQRRALVLESCQMGKLKEAHANNDKISAVRIAKAYLAGTAKEVWVPDAKTQERRDWFHAHRKAVKRTHQARNSLLSYLSDKGVRLKRGTPLAKGPEAAQQLRKARDWSDRQWQVIQGLLMELGHVEEQRKHWRSLIAQEVLSDPQLLSIVRLCGVREIIAFALGAFIGDIQRFAHPKKLVKYVGLNPAFDDSGEAQWSGGIGGHGRKDLRCLLVEGAQAILRSSKTPLAQWGKKLLARKGKITLVVAAIARKLTVAVWYLMMGRCTPVAEIDQPLEIKVSKIIGQVGAQRLQQLGQTRRALRQEAYARLKTTTKVYPLDPNKKFTPRATSTQSVATAAQAQRRDPMNDEFNALSRGLPSTPNHQNSRHQTGLGRERMHPQSTGGQALGLHSCRALSSQPQPKTRSVKKRKKEI
jgi:transposase